MGRDCGKNGYGQEIIEDKAEKVGVEGQILGVTGFQAECFGLKLWAVGSSEVFKHGVIRSHLPFINVSGAVVVWRLGWRSQV